MPNTDWNDFIKDITWFIKPNDKVTLSESLSGYTAFSLSKTFIDRYPALSKLLLKARVTNVTVNDDHYQLLGWTNKRGKSFGWLAKPPASEINKPLCKDHRLLLEYFGGITERWHEKNGSWLLNLNSALTNDAAAEGFQGLETYIDDICSDNDSKSTVNPSEYIAFAFEANGNMTLYHKDNSSVIMIAPDHCFDYLHPYEGYPEYTIYRIDDCPDFVAWVETVAKQQLERMSD
ncbi:hypothetical protein DQG23_01925 [Paenibacillus contaminans]|uniref:Uncharacterized protein n=2 Tax=Paenibacillus contaminans TaxID=450362 RepID=A0A329MT42_9BACL|nr:hypothetical protein DQG23_01925 [Paenibacillus contaminans]